MSQQFFTHGAGLAGPRLHHAWQLLEEAVAQGQIPGAVALIVRRGGPVAGYCVGLAAKRPEARTLTWDTVFDLASLTKVVATTTAIWLLLEAGRLRLDDPVAAFVPGFQGQGREQVAIRHLLTHTSGLPAHRPYYLQARSREAMVAAICAEPLTTPPGQQVVYSDLGYMLLREVVETVSGQDFARFCRERIFAPLGMEETCFCPPAAWAVRTAATEDDAASGQPLCGRVHDENARALGGVSGHAGLFATAGDLARFVRMMLNSGQLEGMRLVSAATVARMTAPATPGPQDVRTLGWQGWSARYSPGGDLFGPTSFGHTGFTGTSLWLDPARNLGCVLLTNRLHFGREATQQAIIRLRARFHNAVVAATREGDEAL